MKKPEYSLHCPCCGRFIDSSETVYNVDGQWVCNDCMMDSVSEDYELIEMCAGDEGSIAEEADYEMRSAIDLAEESYWDAVDHRIDDLKENW